MSSRVKGLTFELDAGRQVRLQFGQEPIDLVAVGVRIGQHGQDDRLHVVISSSSLPPYGPHFRADRNYQIARSLCP